MGVSPSTRLPQTLEEFGYMDWGQVMNAVRLYGEGGYDFGIDAVCVQHLIECDEITSQNIIELHSKCDPPSTIINAVNFLINLISLGNQIGNKAQRKSPLYRLEIILEVIDFSHCEQFSFEEFVIFIMCLLHSYSIVLEVEEETSQASCTTIAKEIFTQSGLKDSNKISKNNVIKFFKNTIVKRAGDEASVTVNTVFETLLELTGEHTVTVTSVTSIPEY